MAGVPAAARRARLFPRRRDRDEALRREKQELLAPALEAAMRRREEIAPQVPEDYTIAALAKPLVEAHGGHEVVEKLAGDSAIGIPRPRDLQDRLRR